MTLSLTLSLFISFPQITTSPPPHSLSFHTLSRHPTIPLWQPHNQILDISRLIPITIRNNFSFTIRPFHLLFTTQTLHPHISSSLLFHSPAFPTLPSPYPHSPIQPPHLFLIPVQHSFFLPLLHYLTPSPPWTILPFLIHRRPSPHPSIFTFHFPYFSPLQYHHAPIHPSNSTTPPPRRSPIPPSPWSSCRPPTIL